MGNLGNFIESCNSSNNCCRHHTRENTELKETNESLPHNVLNIPIRTNTLILEHSRNPLDYYVALETIGTGSFGLVKKVCLKKNPETIRAMKIISKKNILKGIDEADLVKEIYILRNLDHPNIMKIYEIFIDNKNFYIISEFCDQGDLFTKMEKLGNMNEIMVKFIMEQIFNAVSYLHSKGVLHGDIKLENVMLYTTSKKAHVRFSVMNINIESNKNIQKELNSYYSQKLKSQKTKEFVNDMLNYEIKLIDFGCSKLFSKKTHKKISGIIGTSLYCSPEVINNLYDEKCDEWSCGIMMYILLTGRAPFQGENEKEIFEKIKKCEYNFNLHKFKNVSNNCKDLIRKLLEPNIDKRIKANEALRHPFFKEDFNPNKALTENKDLSILNILINIKLPLSKFHEAIAAFLCVNYISKDEEKRLREVFRYIDKESKNFLSFEDIYNCLKENGYEITKDKVNYILKSLDSDSNGKIEYQEFLRSVCDKDSLFDNNNLKNAFDSIDEEMKGFIDSNDIKKFIFKEKEIDDIFFKDYLNQFGMKIDDKITFDDFVYIIKKNKKLRKRN